MNSNNNQLRVIVSNSGPLISLDHIDDGFEFIAKLHQRIYIPESVFQEVSVYTDLEKHLGSLLEVRPVQEDTRFLGMERLDIGETDAIRLAIEMDAHLLIEEKLGRDIATRNGVPMSGIAGQIFSAYRQHVISYDEAADKLAQLFARNRINKNVYEQMKEALILH